MNARTAALLQVAPGLVSLPAYALLAWLLAGRGLPNLFALTLTILLVEVPVSWAIMRHCVRAEAGSFSFRAAFPWFEPVPWWQYLVIGVPLVLFSVFMIGGLGPRVEPPVVDTLFGWLPEWFVIRADRSAFATMTRPMLLALWVLMLVGMVIAGGITQEFYSRGFLLPRTEKLGGWAPLWNAWWFAVLHTVSPWSWPVFFLMVLPWAYVVWWRRSVKIGLFIHVGMLMLQWLGMTLVLFGVVAMPGGGP